MCFGLKKVIKYFENGNVCVFGLRGKGKDLLMSNVIARRNKDYVSNIDYGGKFHLLDFEKIDCGKNDYKNFVKGKINKYVFPYPMGSDIYISDCGIYLPSQYCNELNRDYKYLCTYQALSRQVSHNNVHFNAQNLNRVWDKIREQSEVYLRCEKCFYLWGLVIQKITYYDKYESACNRVKPCRIKVPLFAKKDIKQNALMYVDNFYNQHGEVKSFWVIYFNKSNYDTYYFEKLLGGVKND